MVELSFREALENSKKFDIEPVVLRYMKKNGVAAPHALAVAEETLCYLSICATQSDIDCTIAGEVDEMWHTFILFTERYAEFCKTSFGRFINHRPGEERRISTKQGGVELTASERYSKTINRYHELLGDWPDPKIWPQSLIYRGEGPQLPQPCDPGGDPPICEPAHDPGGNPPWYP